MTMIGEKTEDGRNRQSGEIAVLSTVHSRWWRSKLKLGAH